MLFRLIISFFLIVLLVACSLQNNPSNEPKESIIEIDSASGYGAAVVKSLDIIIGISLEVIIELESEKPNWEEDTIQKLNTVLDIYSDNSFIDYDPDFVLYFDEVGAAFANYRMYIEEGISDYYEGFATKIQSLISLNEGRNILSAYYDLNENEIDLSYIGLINSEK